MPLAVNSKHGEGSGKFVFDSWQKLEITSQGNAEHIDRMVRIHDCKEDFDEQLQGIPENPGFPPPLRCLATLLKVADTLYMDESRIFATRCT